MLHGVGGCTETRAVGRAIARRAVELGKKVGGFLEMEGARAVAGDEEGGVGGVSFYRCGASHAEIGRAHV